jgi:hypothetical protein
MEMAFAKKTKNNLKMNEELRKKYNHEEITKQFDRF